jgi:hypothetical protein
MNTIETLFLALATAIFALLGTAIVGSWFIVYWVGGSILVLVILTLVYEIERSFARGQMQQHT